MQIRSSLLNACYSVRFLHWEKKKIASFHECKYQSYSAKRCHKCGQDPWGKFFHVVKMKDLAKKVLCVGILFHFLKSSTVNFKQEAVSKQMKDISKLSTMCWNIVL